MLYQIEFNKGGNMNWLDLFEDLKIEPDEIDEFESYIKLKGINIYKQLYDIIIDCENNCRYSTMSAVIRYDKGIRNVLYKYLSAFEEKYRADLFEVYDTNEIIDNPEVAKIEKLSLVRKTKEFSDLYILSYSRYFNLSVLRETLYKCNMIDSVQNDQFRKIVKLRNKTMHHNLLMTSYHRDIVSVNKEITEIEYWIELLYKYLPEGMNDEFEKAINRCNNIGTKMNVPNLEKICLREMRNGVFI